ncbi:MAG: Uma2 family endonuclease [Cyanobacteria bacterium J06634_5]
MTFLTNRTTPQPDPLHPAHETLPTMYDLPDEFPEEPGLPDEFHDLQPQLLSRTLSLKDYSESDRFTASDLNVYYDVHHPLWHKRPDWFLAVNVPRVYDGKYGKDSRRSYVVWDEGQSPSIVVEFISPRTEKEDLGRFYGNADLVPDTGANTGLLEAANLSPITENPSPPSKIEVYEQYLKVPHYVVYSKYTQRLRYFKLTDGRYEEQPVQAQAPKLWIAELEIGLAIWDGYFEYLPGPWLRWCDAEGNWLLTDTEQERLAKEEERLAKEEERLAKEDAQAKATKLADKLRELGFDPDQI